MASQNVLNLVDTAMVGVLGDSALAAVGLGGIANFLLTALVLGLSAGVQATAARRVGQRREREAAAPLNGGLAIAVGFGAPWSLVLFFLVPLFFPLLIADSAVQEQGIGYLQARVVALSAMGMNFCFRGFWNGTDRPGLYMRTLLVMHATNIALNWVLIYGNLGAPALGATGAGIATTIATWLGTVYYFALGFRHARHNGFLKSFPSAEVLRGIVRLSLPNSFQQLFFAAGMLAFHVLTGMVGTAELAASNVVVNLLLVGLLPGMGFGLAAISFVGHALGRKDPDDARRWGYDVAKVAFVVVGAIMLPVALLPELVLSIFIHEPDTLAIAVWPLRLVAFFLPFDAAGMVLMHALLGAGDTRRVAIISAGLQWILFLPLVALVGPVLGLGLLAIYGANVLYRGLQTLVFFQLWRRGSWTSIEV
jgi:putative MATE family efflux protein